MGSYPVLAFLFLVGGKLLCCDLCDQSFHPKCIDPEFLELTLKDDRRNEETKWGCPICKGQDPLKNMGHKRMTKTERQVSRRCKMRTAIYRRET